MKKIFLFLSLFVIFVFFVFMLFSESFERSNPKIEILSSLYWNPQKPLKIKISDNKGIKSYHVGIDKYIVNKDFLDNAPQSVEIEYNWPEKTVTNGKKILNIKVTDTSKWNFFSGNISEQNYEINIDNKKPALYLVSKSYTVARGGCALVIFKATDENIQDNYVLVNGKYKFKSFPFINPNYNFSLLAWPVVEQNFRAEVVSTDKAGNKSTRLLDFFIKNYNYRNSNINLSQESMNSLVDQILSESNMQIPDDFVEKFKLMNEKLREENEDKISTVANSFNLDLITDFTIKPFEPLHNGAVQALFGDHRDYYFNKQKISESWHLGIDLASVKQAPIYSSNQGTVVYTGSTGIYGNSVIIYHGAGLYSLYSHCSSISVSVGDTVNQGSLIANTGMTGAVFGDHLHFGMLLQGIEIQPVEWFDIHWLNDNIFKMINEAKAVIKNDK